MSTPFTASTSLLSQGRTGDATINDEDNNNQRSLWEKTKSMTAAIFHKLTNTHPPADSKYFLTMTPSEGDNKFTSFCKALSNLEELRQRTLVDLKVRVFLFLVMFQWIAVFFRNSWSCQRFPRTLTTHNISIVCVSHCNVLSQISQRLRKSYSINMPWHRRNLWRCCRPTSKVGGFGEVLSRRSRIWSS